MSLPELSIVIPCYNEEENVRGICAAVTAEAERHAASHEIILIDNHSTDATRAIIRQLCAQDRRVRAIFNNRNYGQMRSPTHGIYQAQGQAVIGMCADFQDPPAMIGRFLQLWRGGAKIVLAQRRQERSSVLLTLSRRIGYGLLGRFADYPVIPNATGFGLFDRAVVDALRRWNEPEPFFRGMVVESGFSLALIPFDRPERAAGETKNGFRTLISFALSGLAGSAKGLLRLPILLSVWTGIGTIGLLVAALVAMIIGGPVWPLVALTFGAGMFATLLLFIGLIGDQVRLIGERTRGVPLVIEEERINFADRS
ncbi:dolichol monophosphate mannose synthase [Sphingobium sp. C100]|jgi:polyisoprenyl-phosphate glycosyltransferase|uniref:glycosyltransferase family 2 protein n=1 Tax=Sphingobium sp. C100 TaxID=1207055 RepID=UPI0003D63FE3|nr:glycosyltransferase family 2 protein [Sphingobium sp. C100]ETI65688.1 dolichol monophosphate mannose synthase [Sphingobium sp. C100]